MKVVTGTISGGEVGLIVAAVGITSGALTYDIYKGNDHNGSTHYDLSSYLAQASLF